MGTVIGFGGGGLALFGVIGCSYSWHPALCWDFGVKLCHGEVPVLACYMGAYELRCHFLKWHKCLFCVGGWVVDSQAGVA